MLIALVIIAELSVLFITNENIFINGSINKTEVALGWGMWTVLGSSLSVLIPVLFYGFHFNKYPWLYFAVATLTLIFSALTMSRNALLFSLLAYGACVIISCFKGKYKRLFRIITLSGILALIVFTVVLWDKIYALLSSYFELGLTLNGREHLWPAAIDNFLSSPIFGKGFYGLDVTTDFSYGPLALQAHNTVLQLLSATGIIGFMAYAYYRYHTLKPVFVRPTLRKTFMAMSVMVLLLGSLLDNFIFFIYPTFHYTVALVVIHRSSREEMEG
jgi:O-antigen ligase